MIGSLDNKLKIETCVHLVLGRCTWMTFPSPHPPIQHCPNPSSLLPISLPPTSHLPLCITLYVCVGGEECNVLLDFSLLGHTQAFWTTTCMLGLSILAVKLSPYAKNLGEESSLENERYEAKKNSLCIFILTTHTNGLWV